MRSEQEMLGLILGTAHTDTRIRAVILNGSRANPNTSKDIFQDYDIVYIVTDVESFENDPNWIDRFGERMIMQMPDDFDSSGINESSSFAYLIQLIDGNRIDLTLFPTDCLNDLSRDSLSILLLDKDGIIEPFDPPTEKDYLPEPPTEKAFADCCNEFWWISPYVAKGLWRKEIVNAKFFLDTIARKQLMHMLEWYIGFRTGFAVNPGKAGKHFQKYLDPRLWNLLLETYSNADYENTWKALFSMCDLFRNIGINIAGNYRFDYPFTDDDKVTTHLHHVHNLPR